MEDKKKYELQAEVYKVLAHPLRLKIIDYLQEKERSFSQIQEKTGELKSNLSQQLKLMHKTGILKSRKEGRLVFFSLGSKKVVKACHLMRELLEEELKTRKKILSK